MGGSRSRHFGPTPTFIYINFKRSFKLCKLYRGTGNRSTGNLFLILFSYRQNTNYHTPIKSFQKFRCCKKMSSRVGADPVNKFPCAGAAPKEDGSETLFRGACSFLGWLRALEIPPTPPPGSKKQKSLNAPMFMI